MIRSFPFGNHLSTDGEQDKEKARMQLHSWWQAGGPVLLFVASSTWAYKPCTGKVLDLTHLTSWQAVVTHASLPQRLLDRLDLSCLLKRWRETCLVYDLPKPLVRWDQNIFSISATETSILVSQITGPLTNRSIVTLLIIFFFLESNSCTSMPHHHTRTEMVLGRRME